MTIEIVTITGIELFRHYRGQTSAQPCNVSLDCRSGKLRAEYNPEIGNAIPADEYHGHVQTWSIPCLREEAANALLSEIAPIAERVVAGYSREWDGSRYRASFDDDAQAAIREIESLCDAADPSDAVRAWDAGDWLTASGNTSRDAVRAEFGITATTTDEELAAIEARIEEEAAQTGEADVLTGTASFLRRLRDEV